MQSVSEYRLSRYFWNIAQPWKNKFSSMWTNSMVGLSKRFSPTSTAFSWWLRLFKYVSTSTKISSISSEFKHCSVRRVLSSNLRFALASRFAVGSFPAHLKRQGQSRQLSPRFAGESANWSLHSEREKPPPLLFTFVEVLNCFVENVKGRYGGKGSLHQILPMF